MFAVSQAYLPVPPTTRMVVLAASGASNTPTSLTSREYSRSRLTPVVTGELMFVNCLHTSFSSCLQAHGQLRHVIPAHA